MMREGFYKVVRSVFVVALSVLTLGLVLVCVVFALLYGLAVRTRLALYRIGLLPKRRVMVPVISVGNLSMGGTGKTPFAGLLARRLALCGLRPAVVSRGYKAKGGRSDEALMLLEEMPDLIHVEHPDRHAAAQEAIRAGAQVIVLDDGFSHLRLARDLDILLIDAITPFGQEQWLPLGFFREPLSSMKRADWVVVTRCDTVKKKVLRGIDKRLEKYGVPRSRILHAEHQASSLLPVRGVPPVANPHDLKDRRVWAVSGLAHPRGFHRTLKRLGAKVVGIRALPDHFHYDAEWCAARWPQIEAAALKNGAEFIVVTHKDAVKLRQHLTSTHIPVAELRIEIVIREGVERIDELLQAVIDKHNSSQG